MRGFKQWRAVAVDDAMFGESREEGDWRDFKDHARGDRAAFLAVTDPYDRVILERRIVSKAKQVKA